MSLMSKGRQIPVIPMLTENELDWRLIDKIVAGTATPDEVTQWDILTQEQAAYAALIPWLRRVQKDQQKPSSPYYAMDAWQDFKTKLPARAKQPSRGIFYLWRKAAMAAAVALFIGLAWWLYPSINQSPAKTVAALITYTVPNGQRKLVTLPDGTQIWVNAGSSVKVPEKWEADSIREVWLEGEGFFDVVRNASRPFIVHTPETNVRVLGTSFNIQAYQHIPVAVTVATGKVRFSSKNGQSVTLSPNQRSVWVADKGAFETMETDAAIYNGWRDGVIQFRDEPLEKVIATLERRFNVPIKVVGVMGADRVCTARFDASESLDNILESFRHIYGLTITEKEGTVLIQSK
jgi:transmembrane sensor